MWKPWQHVKHVIFGQYAFSLAVEFDNFDFGTWDPNRTHVSVLRDGSVADAVATQATLPAGVDLNNGDAYRAWVE